MRDRSSLLSEVAKLELELGAIKRQLSTPLVKADKAWLQRVHAARLKKINRLNDLAARLRKVNHERETVVATIFMTLARSRLNIDQFEEILDAARDLHHG